MTEEQLKAITERTKSEVKKRVLIHLWERGSVSLSALVRQSKSTENHVRQTISYFRKRCGIDIKLVNGLYHLKRQRLYNPRLSERPLNGLSATDKLLNEVFK